VWIKGGSKKRFKFQNNGYQSYQYNIYLQQFHAGRLFGQHSAHFEFHFELIKEDSGILSTIVESNLYMEIHVYINGMFLLRVSKDNFDEE
jgi:hypothetical protein